MNDSQLLETISDLFDPEGAFGCAYGYFLHTADVANLGGILEAYYADYAPNTKLAYLVLAALHAAPIGTKLVVHLSESRRAPAVIEQDEDGLKFLRYTKTGHAESFFRTVDSGWKIYVEIEQ